MRLLLRKAQLQTCWGTCWGIRLNFLQHPSLVLICWVGSLPERYLTLRTMPMLYSIHSGVLTYRVRVCMCVQVAVPVSPNCKWTCLCLLQSRVNRSAC